MRLFQIAPPAVEPVTLTEAKEYLALPLASTSQDSIVNSFIAAARAHIEAVTNRALLRQRWMVSIDSFPTAFADREIHLPLGRCLSVETLQYRDTNGDWQTEAGPAESPPGTMFEVDLYSQGAGIIRPAGSNVWPSTWTAGSAVRISATFGYGSARADLPPDLRQAVLVRIADLYEGRSEAEGASDVSALMAKPYKIGGFRS